MKKIYTLLLLIFSIFFLYSCTYSTWEDFPDEYVRKIKLGDYNEENNTIMLFAEISLPEGIFADVEGTVVIQICLYCNIRLINNENKTNILLEDIPIYFNAAGDGTNIYPSKLNLEEYGKYNAQDIYSITLKEAKYRARLKQDVDGTNIITTEQSMTMLLAGGVGYAAAIIVAVILGINVNKSLTKRHERKKIEESKPKNYFDYREYNDE